MKHGIVRQKIIETASRLFYRNGYNATGINEIIAEAGIAKATLYNHFASKEDICMAYLQHRNETFVSAISDFVGQFSVGEKQILALFDFLSKFFGEKDFNGCWCIKTVAEIPIDDARIRAEIKTQKTNFIGFIATLLPENSEDLAREIYLIYESAVSESHLHQSDWPIASAKALCAKLLTHSNS